jgi:hypothetical protein
MNQSNLAIILIFLLFSSNSQANECEEISFDVSNLKDGEYSNIKVGETEVVAYKRTKSEIQKAKSAIESKYDLKLPGWWVQKKHPVTPMLENRKTRSLNLQYFIFWRHGPVYGYFLEFVPSNYEQKLKEYPNLTFLGEDWKGGFVDVVNQIAYDFTGRPVIIDVPDDRIDNVGNLIYMNLLLPKQIYSQVENKFKLVCN